MSNMTSPKKSPHMTLLDKLNTEPIALDESSRRPLVPVFSRTDLSINSSSEAGNTFSATDKANMKLPSSSSLEENGAESAETDNTSTNTSGRTWRESPKRLRPINSDMRKRISIAIANDKSSPKTVVRPPSGKSLAESPKTDDAKTADEDSSSENVKEPSSEESAEKLSVTEATQTEIAATDTEHQAQKTSEKASPEGLTVYTDSGTQTDYSGHANCSPGSNEPPAEKKHEPLSPYEKMKAREDHEKLVMELENTVSKHWDGRNDPLNRYHTVKVLCVSWEEGDLRKIIDQTDKVYDEIFSNLCGYEVQYFKIPSHKPARCLLNRLMAWSFDDDEGVLHILIYDGHGSENADRRGAPVWSAGGGIKGAELDSSIVTSTLGALNGDLLIIMDACNSAMPVKTFGPGLVECISSSHFDCMTSGMTGYIQWALMRPGVLDQGISVVDLHQQLLLHVQSQLPDLVEQNLQDGRKGFAYANPRIRCRPVYSRLSPGHQRSILLTRKFEDDGIVDRGSTDFEKESRMRGCRQVNIRMNIAELRTVNVEQWEKWILAAPSAVLSLQVTTGDDGRAQKEAESG